MSGLTVKVYATKVKGLIILNSLPGEVRLVVVSHVGKLLITVLLWEVVLIATNLFQ